MHRLFRIALVLLPALTLLLLTESARAAETTAEIAVPLSLTGPGAFYGAPILDGVRLATGEANRASGSEFLTLKILDDQSNVDRARELAREACATPAVAAVGPALTIAALTAGPTYAECGLVAIAATAHGDDVPKAATTFQPVFNGGSMGSAMAVYFYYVLGGRRAVVLYREDGYGRPYAHGFERAARSLGMDVTLRGFSNDQERAEAVKFVVDDATHPGIALGMINNDAVPILVGLRRAGVRSPVLAPSAIGGDEFVTQFGKEPEEANQKGFFTDNVYAASPILFDSANADVLAFAARFRARYGREPSWPAVQGYDSARVAIAAIREALARPNGPGDIAAQRGAVRDYLVSLDAAHPYQGVTGPIWFTSDRRRAQPVRVGLFQAGLFNSAPIQLVPVPNPAPEEVASGEVFETLPGAFVRRQRVVYTGIFVNEIPRLDVQRSTFSVDFYLWMRVVENAGPISFDPTDIRFVGLSGSSFSRANPSEMRKTPDGTTYRLWRIDAEVRNEYDLHRFPFDDQVLRLAFFNSKADASRVVYVLDRDSLNGDGFQSLRGASGGAGIGVANAAPAEDNSSVVAPQAFRQLTQWRPVSATERRENLVTESPLGAPKSPGMSRARELSGFVVDVEMERRALATASKTLLPLVIMTVILFASLYFPHGLVKEKVTVAITAALSGAVLLTSINTQLGGVGYTIAAEYVFYVYFGLSLLCILSVLMAERLRVAGASRRAVAVERWTKVVFAVTVLAVVGGASYLMSGAAA